MQSPGHSPQRGCPEKWLLRRTLKRPLSGGARQEGTRRDQTRRRGPGWRWALRPRFSALLRSLLPAAASGLVTAFYWKPSGSQSLGVPGMGPQWRGEQEEVKAAEEGWRPFWEEEGEVGKSLKVEGL